MEHLYFDDVELTYEIRGQGEHVVLVHASAFVTWYLPLVEQLADHTVLRYRRRLPKDATGAFPRLTVADDAAYCDRLMRHLGWRTAHVVGHSYGALVALALATSAPERAHTVALLEPAARGVSSSEKVAADLQPVIAAYRAGDRSAAVDGFLRTVCGDGYRTVLDRVVPGAFDDAMAEADLFFQSEMPAVRDWTFGDADLIRQPVLNVLGSESAQRFVKGSELVQSWFPEAERLSVPAAGHLLMVENPKAVARGLRAFFAAPPDR